jgi:hypothetical protein
MGMGTDGPDRGTAGPVMEPGGADADEETLRLEVPLTPASPMRAAGAGGPPPRRVAGRTVGLVGFSGIVLAAALGAWGVSATGDLEGVRTTTASTQIDLASVRTTLDTTSRSLEEAKAELATASTEREAREAEVPVLLVEVGSEVDCIAMYSEAVDELDRISGLEIDNFNRSGEDSVWQAAEDIRAKAMTTALDAYYKAYSDAMFGRTNAARTSVAKGKAAERTIAAQEKKQAVEIATIDRTAAEIETAIDALEARLVATDGACQGVSE